MALDLSLTFSQSNDATYITVTDTTGDYSATNTGGWGTPNEDYADIVISTDTTTASKYHLLLDISVEDKTTTTTTYDQINLYDSNVAVTDRPFADTDDLTWFINPATLSAGGSDMGTSADMLVDGLYTITYSLVSNSNHSTVVDSVETTMFVDGSVRITVYDALREIYRQYDDEINDESREIMETLLKYSYLKATNASATVAKEDKLINMLWTLDKLTSDGSKYNW